MILNSPYISGSLTVTGNTTIQGQLTVTGSLSGTASLASNALLLQGTGSTGFATTASINEVSASQQSISASLLQVSASYIALSGSYNTFSGSASTRITANSSSIQQVSASLLQVSASYIALSGSYTTFSGSASTRTTQIEQVYATTGSNSFRANQSITGSLVVSSTITAQTLVVQTVTSSIIYSSGSNVFGCDLNSRQTFTGSVLITGSLTIAGASSATSYSGATIFGSTAVCSPVGKFTTCIDAGSGTFSSNVCVGGGLVAQQASVFCNTVALFGSAAQLYIGATAGVSDYTILKWCTTDKSLNIHNQSTNGSPQLVIACNGNVGVKTTTAPNYDLEVKGNIGIISSTSAGLITTSTLCAVGTVTGLIRFDGLHSPSLTTYTGPSINACKDDANYATSLVFKTTDGSGGNNVNLRITGAGVACFSGNVCAPAFIGGTLSGTTIYGSTAVCSPVGYFSGCVGVGFTGYGGSKLTLVASTNPTCASSANMQLSIGEASQNTTYSFKLGYIYVGGGYIGAIQTIAGGAVSTTVINPDGGNVGIGTSGPYQNLTVLKNQNADTAAGIYNQTDGTASSATLRLDNGSYNGQLNLYANLYTASGTAVANTLRLYTDGPGGMNFSATNQHIRFYTSPNECLRMTILYGGSVGMGNANPKHNLDICSVTTNAGGLAFCNMVTAQCVWSTFACVGTDSNIVTTITYTNTIDYNRSGVFVARWAYNDTCAALYIRSCLWNDSQNINSFALRNNGGALQICLSGGGDSYRVQVLIQGSKAS